MSGARLTRAWSILGVAAAIGIVACQGKAERGFDPAIGPPILEKYKSVRDARDWLNPYLSVCPQGVILSVRSINRVHDTVQIEALRSTLLDLPAIAWPYGRIVALQDCSIGVPGDTEDRKTQMRTVESVLKGLGLDISRWPG